MHDSPLRRIGLALVLLAPAASVHAAPTFTRDIAPIVYESCAPCHRPGASGPFDLLTAQDLRKRARQVVDVTQSGFMPPWLPEPGYGEFAGERRLTDEQKALIKEWYEAGAPAGDPHDLPPLPDWTEGWQLGEPDLVIRMERPYVLAADGPEVFRNFIIPIPGYTTRYVAAVELKPGNPQVVHHAVMRTDETFSSRAQAAKDPEMGFGDMNMGDALAPDGYLLSWTPGHQPPPPSEGFAWTLRPETDFVLQLHLQPSGRPEPIQAEVGFHYAGRPPTRQIAAVVLRARDIDIPPGEAAYTQHDRYTLPVALDVLSIYPHAHYLGKRFEVWADLPDGSKEWLIRIDDWDFNWQDEYHYARPVHLPAGSEIFLTLVFDNSEGNVRNPFWPPRRVQSGSRSIDEMGTVTLEVSPASVEDKGLLYESLARQDLLKDPEDWIAYSNVAKAAETAGRLDEAIESYRAVLRFNPTRTKAHNGLGRVLQAAGRLDEAEQSYRLALRLNPEYANAMVNLGTLRQQRGDYGEAERLFRRAIELSPSSATAHYDLALLLEQTDRLEEAGAHYETTIELRPDDAEAHNNLAGLRIVEGRTAAAIRLYRRALELDPQFAEARRNLDRALALEAEIAAAIDEALRRVDATGGRDVDALMLLADTYASAGRIETALETAGRALELARQGGAERLSERILRRMDQYRALGP